MTKLISLSIALILGIAAVIYYAWPTKPEPEHREVSLCEFSYCPQLSDRGEWDLLFGEIADAIEWNQLFGKTLEASPHVNSGQLILSTPVYACSIAPFVTSTLGSSIIYTTEIWTP